METTTQQQPIIIKSGGSGTATAVIVGIALIGGYFVVKKIIKQGKENSAEKELDTPEGKIALEFKNLFDDTFVNDADFRRINVQVTSENKDKIYLLYRNLTNRNLSDDIASKISAGAVKGSQKIETYNSTPGTTFKIDENEKIIFQVGTGQFLKFKTAQTAPVLNYASPLGILVNNAPETYKKQLINGAKNKFEARRVLTAMYLKPSAYKYEVTQTKELPLVGLQDAKGWTKYFRPMVLTRKVFAAIQINLGTRTKPFLRWIDARDLVAVNAPKKLNGINLGLIA